MKNKLFIIALVLCALVLTPSCNPDAHWETSNVTIRIESRTISAGFMEYHFSPDKDAYYLIACTPAQEDYNPQDQPKQFMMLALDSANLAYLEWRNRLLKQGEFNIAPFASHSLQYCDVTHFFTNLQPDTEYWVYAFVVNPETLQPVGKLFLETVKTAAESQVDVHFDYRVRGYWDYIYPLDTTGNIYNRFPYVAATRDSLEVQETGKSPEVYFTDWILEIMQHDMTDDLRYGVQVVENDGWGSYLRFEQGHTYYTAIAGFDGGWGNNVIYKFTWTGEDYEKYFTEDEDDIIGSGQDE